MAPLREIGQHVHFPPLNYPTVLTIDPENIKTILATKFEDFNLSAIHVDAMMPIFGHGIFTTDGKA
jgi:hypothetical protein